jgi:DNA-binding transcriptional MerR regulator
MLSIPDSTLRRYVRMYGNYLSHDALKKSKNRRFTDSDILTLKRVRELTQGKKTPPEIETALQVIQDQDQEPDQETLETALMPFPQVLSIIDGLRQEQAETRNVIEQMQGRLDRLERELEYYRLPWLKRIGKKKPE